MKRLLASILTLSLMLGCMAGLVSCSEELEILTKGQWAEKIANELGLTDCELEEVAKEPVYKDVNSDNPYFNAVQSCAAWDIFDKSEEFEPESKSTVGFAVVSAVRAIGMDRLAISTNYQANLQTEEEMLDFFRGISDVDYSSGGALYAQLADEIIQDMDKVIDTMQLQQHDGSKKTAACIELTEQDVVFSLDGESGTLRQDLNTNIQEGSILVLNPSGKFPEGKAAKITSIDGRKFKYVTPPMDEVFDSVDLTGTFTPKVIGVIPMSDDVKVEKINENEPVMATQQKCVMEQAHAGSLMYVPKQAEAKPMAADVSLNDITFSLLNKSGKKGYFSGQVNASLGLRDISVTADIKMRGLSVQRAYAKIHSTMYAKFNASGDYKPDTKPLAKVVCSIYGAVTLEFQANLSIGASGEITVDWSLPTTIGTEYKKNGGVAFIKEASGANLTAEAHAEAFVRPGIKGVFKVIGFSVASCGAYSGVSVKIDAKAETKGSYSCINLKAYVPLECFAGGEGKETLLAKLGAAQSWTIWDENSSQVKKEWHIEDGKVVDHCTKTGEEPEQTLIPLETVKPSEISDYDVPTVEEVSSRYFSFTDNMFISLSENTCEQMKLNVPEGYAKGDIRCISSNKNVVSVNNSGQITANGEGVTQIKIQTKDGNRIQYCAVSVAPDFSVEVSPIFQTSTKMHMYKPLTKAC